MTGKYMDYRYMATSDLLNELNKEGFKVDTDLEAKLANIVIQQLDDAAGDVSGLAIKCIALLVKKIREQHVLEITSRLCDKLLNGKEQNRDIANIALKTIVAEVPSSSVAHSVLVSISTKLIRGITTQGMGTEIKCECLDILCDLLHKYGNLMASDHEVLLGVLLPQLNTNEASVRKKTVSCIASLASSLSDDLLAKSTIEKALFDKLSTSNTSFDVLLDSLLSSAKSSIQTGGVAKQVLFAVAQCVAILCLTAGDKKCSSTVNLLTDILKSDSSVDSAKQHLSLLCLGEIGRKKDLSYHDNIENIIIESFNSPFEEINSAASYALGNIAVGNLPKYLPFILDKIDNQQKKQYLLLHSLKEIIVRQSIDKAEFDDSSIVKITSLLFNHCESDEESVRNVVAECLGKIALIEPGKLVPALKERTSNPVAFTRATVVLAVKYSIVERQEKIDEILYHEIASFLMLVKDHDRRVRCAAVLALRTAAHNKPNLIKGLLPEILPLLYDQTVIKKELIRTVDLGHFKHTVDDGLELRKAAFECVDTLLESCLDQVNPSSFIVPYLLSGLDDHYDVKMPCHLILSKLADMCPSAVLAVLDSLVNPLQKTINFRPKHDAVKQEVDHNEDMICSALRAIASLNCMRKVKILKAPKFDLSRLMEVHGDYSEDVGVKFERPSEYTVPAEGTEEGTSVLWGRISETRLVMTVDSRATKAIRVGRRQVRILTKDNAIKYHKFKGGIVTLCGNAKRCRDMLDHVRITLKNREMEENQANIVELGVQWFADNDLVDRRTATINVCQWIASNQAWNLVAFGDQYPDGACVKLIDGETLYGCGSGSQTAIRNLRSSQNPISFETFKEEIIRTSLRDLGTGGLGHVFCFETDGEISRETIDIMDFLCTAEDNFYATEVFSSNNFFIVTGVEDENAYTPFDLHEIAKRLFPRARFNNMSRWIRRTDHLIICLVKLHSVGQRQRMMDLFNPPPRTALPAVFNFTNTRSHNNRSKGLVALASPNFLFHARTAQNIYDLRLLCI